MSQNDPNTTSLMTSLKTCATPTKNFFFECRLEDWPIHLSPSTAH